MNRIKTWLDVICISETALEFILHSISVILVWGKEIVEDTLDFELYWNVGAHSSSILVPLQRLFKNKVSKIIL